jgi:DNA helicase-2/ATP-dependent DNA helicase PcrA
MFRDDQLTVVLGGPGAGKTERLIEIVREELKRGVPPDQIAYVAFTRAAAETAKARAAEAFGLDPRADLPWFRTIHSLAYFAMGITQGEVMTPRDWEKFGKAIGERLSGARVELEEVIQRMHRATGDVLLGLVDYAATTCQTLDQARQETGVAADLWHLQHFKDSLDAYKRQFGKVTFTDLLLMYPQQGTPPSIQVAIIDEAQDLTQAQWRMVEWAFQDAERVYAGGDDDQAIYRWAGADVEYFLNLPGQKQSLPRSHRLPQPIYEVAQRVVGRIRHRYAKDYAPAKHQGDVISARDLNDIDLTQAGSWMLLARNSYLLHRYKEYLEGNGYPYQTVAGPSVKKDHFETIRAWDRMREGATVTAGEARNIGAMLGMPKLSLRETQLYQKEDFYHWPWPKSWHEAFNSLSYRVKMYYQGIMERGENVIAPRFYLGTIHSVKGDEADHVVLQQDVSGSTMQNINTDHEHRVFYVGVTRARQTLTLLRAQTLKAYNV